jgi:hypothetical protein
MSFAFGQTQTKKGSAQDNDIPIPNPPSDCISSIALNGSLQTPSSMLAVAAWDGTVSYFRENYLFAVI